MPISETELGAGTGSAHHGSLASPTGVARNSSPPSRAAFFATPRGRAILRAAGYGGIAIAIAIAQLLRDRGPHPVRATRRTATDLAQPYVDVVSDLLGLSEPVYSDSDMLTEAIIVAVVMAKDAFDKGNS